jgi:mono/diheme cytochrome c family protein
MNKYLLCTLAWATMISPLPAHGQMGMQGRGMMGGGMMNNRFSVRRYYVMQNGIDPRYASQENPLEYSSKNISDGKRLYDQNCAMCHGPTGLGDGPAGRGMNPPPANIAAFIKSPMETDGYLYWTIAEGGAPLKTAMPPFKNTLKENDIWKIIVYLRGL